MIGFCGVLRVVDGVFTLGRTDDYDVLDEVDGPEGEPEAGRVGALGGPLALGIDPDFLDRYGRLAAHSSSGPGGFRSFRVVDHYLGMTPQGPADVGIEPMGRVPGRVEDEALVHEFAWGPFTAIPDLLDVEAHVPHGWTIDEVERIRGGNGQDMGVYGEGVELHATTDGSTARLSGTVRADTRLRVHLTGGSR